MDSMDDKSSIYNIHLCRICQNPKKLDLVCTSDTAKSDDGKSCLETLKYIFSEIIWVEDCLLSLVCRTCLKMIYETAQFKQLCLESHRKREQFNYKYIELINEPFFNDTDNVKHNPPCAEIKEPAAQIEEVILPYNNAEILIKAEKIDNVLQDVLGEMQLPKSAETSIKTIRLNLKRKAENTSLANGEIRTLKLKKFAYIPSNVKIISTRLSEYIPRTNPRSHDTVCKECRRIFNTGFELRDHIATQHNNKIPRKYRCEFCHIGFATSSEFECHFKKSLHKEYVPLQCNTCGCKTISRHTYNAATTTINCLCTSSYVADKTERPKKKINWQILCMQCNASFLTLRLAQEHKERVHSTSHPIGCSKCDSSFLSKKLLNDHIMKNHHFRCGQCLETFDVITELSKHRKLAHRPRYSVVNVIPSPQGLHCLLCKRVFLTRNSLESHIESRACELYGICGLCGVTFHESRIKRHLVMNHGVSGTKKEDFEQYFVRKVLAKQLYKDSVKSVASAKCEQYRECNLCSKYLHVSRMKIHLIYSHKIDACDKNFRLQSYYNSKKVSLKKMQDKIELSKKIIGTCDAEHSYSLRQKKLVNGVCQDA